MTRHDYDVAIIGGGLAGSLLARQLRRQLPDARVAVFEKSQAASFKVGESTVELASNYLVRRVGLSRYLYEHHLPKNGLRFFFDTPARDAALEAMSEIGSVALPYLPAFQIDRARFETDLCAMNQEDGVDVVRGKVTRLALDGASGHRFEVQREGGKRDGANLSVSARWVVDASGRASLLAKKLALRVEEPHAIAAVWGRYENVVDLDDVGSASFRRRINHTSRVLSTNHFCYPGYWIWFIPLKNGVTSVGLVIERSRFDDAWRTPAGFASFLDSHRAVRDLLAGAKPIDIMSYGQLAYGVKRYFSADRWAVTGEAGAFTDPFYSPGSDFIAIENDLITDLVSRDLAGDGELESRVDTYDELMRFRFDTTMQIYRGQYGLLGSYDLYRLKWDFDIACYYNLWLEPFMRDEHLDVEHIRGQLRQRRLVNAVMKNFGELFRRVEAHLVASGRYGENNLGAFTGEFPTMRCAEGLGSDASSKASIRRTAEAFNLTRRRALAMLGSRDAADLPLTHYLSGKPLV